MKLFSRAIILVWTFTWFALILPGHKRGSVVVPQMRGGLHASALNEDGCCSDQRFFYWPLIYFSEHGSRGASGSHSGGGSGGGSGGDSGGFGENCSDCDPFNGESPVDPVKSCALCFQMAVLGTPLPPVLLVMRGQDLDEKVYHLPRLISDQAARSVYQGRGPPGLV